MELNIILWKPFDKGNNLVLISINYLNKPINYKTF